MVRALWAAMGGRQGTRLVAALKDWWRSVGRDTVASWLAERWRGGCGGASLRRL